MSPDHTVDADRVATLATRSGLEVDDAVAAALADQFTQQDEVLAALAADAPPTPPDRTSRTPSRREDPLGMWLTTCAVADPDATGRLDGLTVGVKDNIAVAGVPMTCGSPLLADTDYTPVADATVVDRLLAAGATIAGKTNMDEFAFGGDRDTMRLRLAHNPRDPARMPGSSSAGSGIAAATDAVDLALGSDTGGSVRFPAAWSGVPGIKPTRGLVSHRGFVQFARTLDHIGVLAGDITDLAAGLATIAGPDPGDPLTRATTVEDYPAAVATARTEPPTDLTIGIPEELWGTAPALDDVARDALEGLAADGATLEPVSIEGYDRWLPAWLGIGLTEVGRYLAANTVTYWHPTPGDAHLVEAVHDAIAAAPEKLGDPLVAAMLYADHRRDRDGDAGYVRAHRAREQLTAGIDAALADVDVLASTTVPMVAPLWDEEIEDVFGALAHTGPFNVSGHPAVSVPCGTVEGLPVGLQFVAPHFEEVTALRAATQWLTRADSVA